MFTVARRGAVALLLISTLAGCSAAAQHTPTLNHPISAVAEAPGNAFNTLLAGSRDLGAVPPSRRVSVLLLLRDPGSSGLTTLLTALYNPRSGSYGKFVTPAQVARFGPPRSAVDRVRSVLSRWGLSSTWRPGEAWLTVRAPASTVQRVFRTSIHDYRAPSGQVFVASTRDSTVPAALRALVTGVSRVQTFHYLQPHDIPSTGLGPRDIRAAYDVAPLQAAGMTGAGQTVVFFEIDGYKQADLNAYASKYGLPPLHPLLKAGPQMAPGGEAEMDLEAVHAVAPDAKLVVYNLNQDALANNTSSDTAFVNASIAFQQKIVRENPHAIVSNSVGTCAPVLGRAPALALKNVYDQADALGEAWFAASGDQGAFDCMQALERQGAPPQTRDIGVDLPASVPGVTGVGGTRLSVRNDGSWFTEEAWEGPADVSGGGGGFSTYFARPSWQQAPGVGNAALDPNSMREVPDVSAVADPDTSGNYNIGGSNTIEGGTSQAAPIWAGIMALIDQYLQKNGAKQLGFANPALYALARAAQPYPPYHDVTMGSNLVYPATVGYDMATGLGTPDAWNLARDLLQYQRGGGR